MRLFFLTTLSFVALVDGSAAAEPVAAPADCELVVYLDLKSTTFSRGFRSAALILDGVQRGKLTTAAPMFKLKITAGTHLVGLNIYRAAAARKVMTLIAGQRVFLRYSRAMPWRGLTLLDTQLSETVTFEIMPDAEAEDEICGRAPGSTFNANNSNLTTPVSDELCASHPIPR